ncbi:hypothetical protein Tco_0570233, partial [Tanacetum coccineum]
MVFVLSPVSGCDRLVIRAKVIENQCFMACMVSIKEDLYKLLLVQIMAASAIIISSDSSDESRLLYIAPVISSAAPMVETTIVASPTRLCGLVPYTGFDSDAPDEYERVHQSTFSPVQLFSPFICTDSSDRPPLQDPYVATVARWRSSGSILLGVDAPDLLIQDLRLRDVSPRLCYPFRASSTTMVVRHFRRWCAALLSYIVPVSDYIRSSSGDSSERHMHLSSHSAGHILVRRCRIPRLIAEHNYPCQLWGSELYTVLISSPPRTGVDMELGIGDGDEVADHVEIDHRDARDDTEEYKVDTSIGDTAEVGIDLMTAPLVEEEIIEPAREDSPDSSGTRDGIVRSVEDIPVDLGDAVRDFYHHMSEVRVDRIVGIETTQRRLEADQLIA